jgi:hypothetical protein
MGQELWNALLFLLAMRIIIFILLPGWLERIKILFSQINLIMNPTTVHILKEQLQKSGSKVVIRLMHLYALQEQEELYQGSLNISKK